MAQSDERAYANATAQGPRLSEQVEQRRRQELDRSRGEPVWFSRRILNGHLLHWALFTYGKKYELRLPSKDTLRSVGSNAPALQYEVKIAPWSVKDEMTRQKQESQPQAPQDYYICQIGWTKLAEKQIEKACADIRASFVLPVLGFKDSQAFLKRFSKQIIKEPEDCALDYPWFATNVETSSHELQLVQADEDIMAYQTYKQTAIYEAASAATVPYQREKPMETAPQGSSGKNSGADQNDSPDCSCCF
ncbi:hypothetical protein HJFPF1_12687 [Paramyrothecium foliicola]|nr:hypothetical protein HJFPF1_12687 [Paramyrothecium foliicola]